MKLPTAEKQFLARAVREQQGIELTPDEAEQMLSESLAVIRRDLIAAGFPGFADVPDEQLREFVRQAMGWDGAAHPG